MQMNENVNHAYEEQDGSASHQYDLSEAGTKAAAGACLLTIIASYPSLNLDFVVTLICVVLQESMWLL